MPRKKNPQEVKEDESITETLLKLLKAKYTDEIKELKENTLKTHIRNVIKIHRIMFNNAPLTDLSFLGDFKRIKKFLSVYKQPNGNPYSENTIRNLMYSMFYVSNAIPDFNKSIVKLYKKEFEGMNTKLIAKKEPITENQKEQMEDGKENIKKIISILTNKLADKSITKQQYQVLIIYQLLEQLPRRNDIGTLQFITHKRYLAFSKDRLIKDKINYIMPTRAGYKLAFVEYKTDKSYGIQEYIIKSAPLNQKIRAYIKFINKDAILFKNTSGDKMTRKQVSDVLLKTSKDITGKQYGTTVTAKINLDQKLTNEDKKSLEKAKSIGDKRGTALSTLQSTYVKKSS